MPLAYGVGARNAVEAPEIHRAAAGHHLASLSRHSSLIRSVASMAARRASSTETGTSAAETMTNRMIDRTIKRAALGAVVALLAALTAADVAQPQSADCARLRQAISDASRNDQGAQYQAAAAAPARRTRPHHRLRPLDRLRPQAIPVLRLGAAGPMRPDQRADRAHARQSRRIAVRAPAARADAAN